MEKWQEFYSMEEINKIQEIELKSLDVFTELCRKLDIDFFLYGGSLLGAVKYNGFVPWDDDLDVALLRTDYEKLLQQGPKIIPPEYEIQHPSMNKVTPYPYIKFRYKNSAMVEYANHRLKMNHGIYFDIYPLDNIPDDDTEYRKIHKKFQRLASAFVLRQSLRFNRPVTDASSFLKASIKVGFGIVFRIMPRRYFITRMNMLMTKYNGQQTKRQGNYFFPRPLNYFDGISPAIKVRFENRDMLMPKGYKVNLNNRYGDITLLPPEEKRIGHRPYVLHIEEK